MPKMQNLRIVLPDPDTFGLGREFVTQLSRLGSVSSYTAPWQSAKEFIHRIDTADIIIPFFSFLSRETIQKAPELKYIVVPSVGYDMVDMVAARERGITVLNCPTYNSLAVAEFTVGLMYTLLKRIGEANQDLRKGVWKKYEFVGTELSGKALGLIGSGRIGSLVAAMAKTLGMKVRVTNSRTSDELLDKMFSKSDIISLHVPYHSGTRHLVNGRRLDLMKEGSYLINTSRGGVIDETALYAALQSGQLAGAALDVFEHEPAGPYQEGLSIKLVRLPTVVATPHMAFHTKEAVRRLRKELLENISACIAGQALNAVN